MSTVSLSELGRYQSIPETKVDLPYADLITLDLSKFDQPGGKEALAQQLHHAIHTVGFFYLKNFGLSDEEVERQFDLAIDLFSLPLDEKLKYPITNELKGGPLGYKPRGVRKGAHGLMDNSEIYDDPKYIDFFEPRGRPEPFQQAKVDTEKFCRHIHEHMLKRLLILVAIIMELEDEEALWKIHDYSKVSNCHMRYMVQHPRTPEEIEIMRAKGGEEVIYGHTDFGTFTFLFRQPIAGLQVRLEEEKEWRWVKPVDGACVVNVAVSVNSSANARIEVNANCIGLVVCRIH
ncbi:Clavaminate synthase-like protein [Eremomyces bilateralis CBS 781.70]|uniref:Clavaminate synthase-like protein n=1 Tax=Eremomyces bilateralis CBS 781.70 TaxID=1392243 RepID=A0A6G1GCE4_9PEZI|nr:Clavaminate synthase-like protein [Eremomyces bilateralis CBS 781.70]KAF1815662.1 Clavaminate synthase-like protein [Eremomyces bilateralis CBS 781.70]